jgi:hypothetical protein
LRSRVKPAVYAIDPWHSRRRWCSRSRNEESWNARMAGGIWPHPSHLMPS